MMKDPWPRVSRMSYATLTRQFVSEASAAQTPCHAIAMASVLYAAYLHSFTRLNQSPVAGRGDSNGI